MAGMQWFWLAVLVAFVVLAGIGALWRRESIFDTMEFDSHRLFRNAKIVVLAAIALAFLLLFIINNWRLLIG